MDGKMLARLGAVVFVGVAITATVIELTRKEKEPEVQTLRPVPAGEETALRQILGHCRDIGEAATRDPACLNAWAENRDRFLGQGPAKQPSTVKTPAPEGPATLFPGTAPPSDNPLIKESAPAAEDAAPVAQPEPARPGAH
jgi:conjugative transfer region protein TrbK